MRLALLIAIVAACRGEPKPQIHEDAAAPPPMTPSNNTAVRDATFVAVPTAAAVADVLARIVTKSPEESAKEIMRTLGRLGWKLGSQRYDVYLPQATRVAVRVDGVDVPAQAVSYSASGKARGRLAEEPSQGAVVLVRSSAGLAAAERAGAAAVIVVGTRGTALRTWRRPGDPLTPGVAALPGAARAAIADVDVLPKIPVVHVDVAPPVGARVEIAVVMDRETRPVRDIIAILEGTSQDAVIVGTAYDRASQAGTAALIEIARGITALSRAGWRPQRTIILAFWDASQPGLLGSTEWVEEQATMLRAKAVGYLDIGEIGPGSLVAHGSAALARLVAACQDAVDDPRTNKRFVPTHGDIGATSDATPFLHHAGVPALHWKTDGEPRADPDFTAAVAKQVGLCMLRLADGKVLPISFVATADGLAAALAKLGAPQTASARVEAAIAKLRVTAVASERQDPKCNAALAVAERGFLAPDGPWYRHLALGADEGGAAVLLPELAAAKTEAARATASMRLAAAIERVTTALEACVSR